MKTQGFALFFRNGRHSKTPYLTPGDSGYSIADVKQLPKPVKIEVTTASDSIGNSIPCKPEKPNKVFALYPHNSMRSAKKFDGKTFCFESWDDPDDALAKFQAYDFIAG